MQATQLLYRLLSKSAATQLQLDTLPDKNGVTRTKTAPVVPRQQTHLTTLRKLT